MKLKVRFAKCLCCQNERHKTEVKQILSILDKRNSRLYPNLKGWNLDSYKELIDSYFYWACDYCLTNGSAVLSNMSDGQGTETPHLAYFDTSFLCKVCGIECVFTVSEKKAWYEQYQLPISSIPDKCLKCRKNQKLLREQNKLLSDLIKKEVANLTEQEIEQVIAIYTKWEKNDKVGYYTSILKKRYR